MGSSQMSFLQHFRESRDEGFFVEMRRRLRKSVEEIKERRFVCWRTPLQEPRTRSFCFFHVLDVTKYEPRPLRRFYRNIRHQEALAGSKRHGRFLCDFFIDVAFLRFSFCLVESFPLSS